MPTLTVEIFVHDRAFTVLNYDTYYITITVYIFSSIAKNTFDFIIDHVLDLFT